MFYGDPMAIIAPDVIPEPIPDVQLQPKAGLEAFGGGAGLEGINQKVQGIAQSAGEIASLEMLRANQTAVQEAQDKATSLYTDKLYNPQTGVIASRGKDALPATIEARQKFRQGLNDVSETLTNPIQKGAFNRVAYDLDARFNTVAMQHADTEHTRYDNETNKNFLNNQLILASKEYHPDSLDNHILPEGIAAIRAHGQRNGQDEETIKARISDFQDNVAFNAITQGMLRDPANGIAMSKQYLEEHKDDISPNVYNQINDKVQEQVVSNAQVDAWQKVSGMRLGDGTIDMARAQRYVNSIGGLDDDDKGKVFKFVHANAEVADKELADQHKSSERVFNNQLLEAKMNNTPLQDVMTLAMRHAWDDKSLADMQENATKLYTGKIDNWTLWSKKQPEETQGAIATAEQTIKAKYPNRDDSLEYQGALNEFHQQAMNKRPEQIRQIANDLTKNVVVKPGWFWDTKEPAWKVTSEARAQQAADLDKLDNYYGSDKVQKATDALRKGGQPQTPANIKALLDNQPNP